MEKLYSYQKFKINLDKLVINNNFYTKYDKIIRLVIDILLNDYIFNLIYPCNDNKNLEIFKKFHYKFRKENNDYKIILEKSSVLKLIYLISLIIELKKKNENEFFPKKMIYIMINNKFKKCINNKIKNYFNIYSKFNENNEDKYKYSENKNLNLSAIISIKTLVFIFNLTKNVNNSLVKYSILKRRFFFRKFS